MRRTTIPSLDVEAGDVIDCCGRPHRVAHVDLHGGWAWPIAFDDEGWAMALGPVPVEVRREGAGELTGGGGASTGQDPERAVG
jgi:hypothetical protein